MKTIIALSGGLDSTVLLAKTLEEGQEVILVSFRYPSKHNIYELEAAISIAAHYHLNLRIVNLDRVFDGIKSNLLMAGGEIPEGHYQEESMKLTVVPARNMIFLSVLTALGISEGAQEIRIGVHQGDHAIYPDCSPDFIRYMRYACYFAGDPGIGIGSPFLFRNKSEIVEEGLRLNAPLHLTRTCYKRQVLPCGRCGSCCERLEAFKLNNSPDPLVYEELVENERRLSSNG